jgi:acyl-CoA synthetase (NDP forming)
VVTTSGGACGILADLADGTAIELPDFAPETKARVASVLPVFGTAQNPLDTTGVIVDQPELLAECLRAVADEGTYDAFLVNTDPPREPGPNPERVEQRVALLAAALSGLPFAAVASTAAMDLTPYARDLLVRHRLHFANGLTFGALALHHAIEYGRARAKMGPPPPPRPRQNAVGSLAGTLNEAEGKRLLAAYGIAAAPERVATTAEAAADAAAELGYPVVVKVLSRDITHKTEVGGVRLGLRDRDAVIDAFDGVTAAARAAMPSAVVEGVIVARQMEAVAELLVGMKRDPLFGPVLVVAMGGVLVEVLQDVSLRLPPVGEDEAREMLDELRGAPLLHGIRGRPSGDAEAAARAIAGLSELVLDLGDHLQALDVNPLFVMPSGEGVFAGDALVELL